MTAFGSTLILPSQPSEFFMMSASVTVWDVWRLRAVGVIDCGELAIFFLAYRNEMGVEANGDVRGE